MFEQAFPPGAQLMQVAQPDGPVKIWATRGTDGRQRIVIINEDPASAQTVQLSVPGAGGAASLDWLKAPNLLATSDVTLGNQSFGDETRSGLLRPARVDPITATAGTYSVELPATSAVLLTQ
jgi:hypothetical protein